MRPILSLMAGLAAGAVAAAALWRLSLVWAVAVGVVGGLAIWYVIWGRHDLEAAVRRRAGGHD